MANFTQSNHDVTYTHVHVLVMNIWRKSLRVLRASLAMVVLLPAVTSWAVEPGTLVFSEDFDTIGVFAERWDIAKEFSKSTACKDGKLFSNGGITLRQLLPDDFYMTFDMAVQTPECPEFSEVGFIGAQINDILFVIVPAPKHGKILWSLPGEKQTRGVGKVVAEVKYGEQMVFAISRKRGNGCDDYTFKINDTVVGNCVVPTPTDGMNDQLAFTGWRLSGVYDNLQISTLKIADASPNSVINSSFEYAQEGFPLYFCRNGIDYTKINATSYTQFLNACTLDSTEYHSGKQSLKLVLDESTSDNSIAAWGCATLKGKAGVFSAWLKADRENFPVTLRYDGKKTEVLVGTEWQRYEIVNSNLKGSTLYPCATIIISKVKGALWIDDLQVEFIDNTDETVLEPGKTMATPYKISDLDKVKFGVQETPVRANEFAVPLVAAGVTPSLDIDAWKDHAVKLDQFHYKKHAATNPTEVYAVCDQKNLYLGFRCFVPELSKVESTGSAFLNGVEIFIDPVGEGRFYHYSANLGGRQINWGKNNDTSWNANWESQAKLNEKSSSVDYFITLPLSDFAEATMKQQWLVNFCRNDSFTAEASSLADRATPYYADTAYWPVARFPEEVVKSYTLGVVDAACSETTDGETVALTLDNRTGKILNVTAELTDIQNNTGVVGAKTLVLCKGRNNLSFAVKSKTEKVMLRLSENGEVFATQTLMLNKRNSVTMLGRFNYYMNEPEATFKVTTTLSEPEKLMAVLTVGDTVVKQPAFTRFKMVFPLKDLADGTYDAVLSLQCKGQIVATTKAQLIKRPYRENSTQINHFTRSLWFNGKPIFPIALFHPGATWFRKEYMPEIVEHLKRSGFKYTHFSAEGVCKTNNAGLDNALAFLDATQKEGLNVILWSEYRALPETEWDWLQNKLDYPCVLTQMVIDEPELMPRWKSEDTKAFLSKMRARFPYQPVQMNNTVLGIPANYADLNTDILGLDDYLSARENRTVESVLAHADIMWNKGKATGKPCFYFLVGGNFSLEYREPSYGEQIAQTYGSIAAGCSMISYFYGYIYTPGNWKALLQVNQEVLALTDVLCSEEEIGESSCSAQNTADAKLRHITKKYEGYIYVISVNTGKKNMDKVAFTLPAECSYVGEADVLFESRKVQVENGTFSDDFGGHERHVYKIKVSQ